MVTFVIPTGALDVAIPRTPSRILLQTAIVHAYTLVTYSYLCSLVPRWRRKTFFELAAQLLVFWNLPELLPLQILSFAAGSLIEEVWLGGGSDHDGMTTASSPLPAFLVRYARLVGLGSFRDRKHIREVALLPWFRAAVIPQMLWGCMIGLTSYAGRFKIGYHASVDVGMLGIDHRNGWLSGEGLLAGVIALSYNMHVWYSVAAAKKKEEGGEQSVYQTVEEAAEGIEEAKLDGLLSQETQGGGSSGFDWSFENKTFLAEAFVAAVIHQFPLVATHRSTGLLAYFLPILAIVVAMANISMRHSSPNIARKAQMLLGLVAVIFVTCTIVQSTNKDLSELGLVQDGYVQPWNMRWKVTDRFDRMLRPLI